MSEGQILVIKLGALGDFVQAMGPFAAIRQHHPDAKITLLTTKAYADFAKSCPYFDEVWTDQKPKVLQVGKWLNLQKQLREGNFQKVYDLQTSDRSSHYFRLFKRGTKPDWSGIARGCSHPHANPRRDYMHTIERQAEQLAMAGIKETPFPSLAWVDEDLSAFNLPEKFALLVPGGAPHRPAKRWPSENFGALATSLMDEGITPVLLGAGAEATIVDTILKECPNAISLVDQTTFAQIAALAKKALFSIGNDTGPLHIISLAGCKSVALYSHESDPALCAQRGEDVTILREERLENVYVDQVLEAVKTSNENNR
ncbi:MAG: glycosyltransferase family 9 protein [Rhodospirillales bacterium]|nr:glycosyltransferase family 9 protein [Rhodospirillales bacterium]